MAALELDDDTLTAAVSKSIVDSLTPEVRQQLITDAIAQLIKPGEYGRGSPSALQMIFRDAVSRVATRYVQDQLATDEAFIAQVRGLLEDATRRLFEAERRAAAVENIAKAIERSFTERDRY